MQSITTFENAEIMQAGLLGSTSLPLITPPERCLVPRFTVLSVDDNDDLRHVMGLILSTMGFHVISCNGAEAASAEFRSRNDIDLLITDLEMPGRSGAELARELSALCSSLPVLVVSGAYISQEFTQEMGERGWRFLAKPYALPVFSTIVHSLIAAGADQQQAA